MQEQSTSQTGAPPQISLHHAQDSHIATFLIATFFLLSPIVLLLFFAARERRTPYEEYLRAVRETAQPNSLQVSYSLLPIGTDQPVRVATWTRRDQISNYQGKTAPANKDVWVTVVPHLKSFCQDYVRTHGDDPKQLSLRLTQRLGLPPDSNYDSFVELTVDPKDLASFFRPCSDPAPATKTCPPVLPLEPNQLEDDLKASDPQRKQEVRIRYWFLNNYYASFASSRQYPWTGLGYTFDWAPKGEGGDFVRFGESEFVIPAGTPIKFESATDTVGYCTPKY